MTDFQAFIVIWFGALGVMVAFAALHYVAHICDAIACEGFRRLRRWRNPADARVASLRPLSNGRTSRDLAALQASDRVRRNERRTR